VSRPVRYGLVVLAGVVGGVVGGWLASEGVPLDWLLVLVGLPLISLSCFRQLARRDPVACASILVPAWVAGLLAIPLAPPAEWVLELASAGWLLLFILGGRRIWPTWSRLVLGRRPSGSA
jgi:hypothetical protein